MGDSTEIRLPPTASESLFHSSFDGQAGSEGRMRFFAEAGANIPRGHRERGDAAPATKAFKSDLRSTGLFLLELDAADAAVDVQVDGAGRFSISFIDVLIVLLLEALGVDRAEAAVNSGDDTDILG